MRLRGAPHQIPLVKSHRAIKSQDLLRSSLTTICINYIAQASLYIFFKVIKQLILPIPLQQNGEILLQLLEISLQLEVVTILS
jgi:hypothetical protein